MKSNFKFILAATVIMACSSNVLFTSCSSDNSEVVTANTEELSSVLADCESLLNKATTDDYPQAAITTFQGVINTVKTAMKSALTQNQVDNMVEQLNVAKKEFEKSAFDAIPEDELVANFTFDEGKGTTATSTGTQKWVAKFQTGPVACFGAQAKAPEFVSGKVGTAISLSKGAHLTVDEYNTNLLLGNELTISVWVNASETRAGNYIVSFNYWNNWKLNLQTEDKPFFTIATSKGILDADNEQVNSAPNNTWTHLGVVLSLTSQTLSFYVNGELTKTWTAADRDILTGSPATAFVSTVNGNLPLVIGAATTYAEAASWNWFTASESAWDGFVGKIDELKIFNKALTAGQINKIYNSEK